MNKKKVFVDMDGVLADFEKAFDETYGELKKLSYDELVEIKKIFADDAFFLTLPIMAGAGDLMCYLNNKGYAPTILTSAGKFDTDYVAADKKTWLAENFEAFFEMGDFLWVTSSYKKANFVNGWDCYLIDDRAKAVDPWLEAGGSALLYTDFESAKAELDEVL